MLAWEDFKSTVTESGKVVVDKIKGVTDLATCKAQIVNQDAIIDKQYKLLGKAYYESFKDEAKVRFDEIVTIIDDAEKKKAELQDKINEASATIKCPECGLAIDKELNFCPMCGTKLEKEEPVEDAKVVEVEEIKEEAKETEE